MIKKLMNLQDSILLLICPNSELFKTDINEANLFDKHIHMTFTHHSDIT